MRTTRSTLRSAAQAMLLLLLFVSVSRPSVAQSPSTISPRSKQLDEYLQAATRLGRFSGSVLVAERNAILLDKGYGLANVELGVPNTPTTRHRIGSITKPITAVAIMQLQEQGKLKVTDPICRYLFECPVAWQPITIAQLLSHTSGIPNYMAFPDFPKTMREPATVESLIARFKDKPLDFVPGTEYRYSNSGYVLLGAIITRVSGTAYMDVLQRSIFGPAGMTSTGYDVPTTIIPERASGYSRAGNAIINAPFIAMSIPFAAGGLYSTTADLHRFVRALDGGALLQPSSRDAMWTAVQNGYGYGWGVSSHFGLRCVEHTGQVNGFTGMLAHYPEQQLTVVILTNSDKTEPSVERVAQDLAAIVFGKPYELPKERPRIGVASAVLDSYVGQYELKPGLVVSIYRADSTLYARFPGQFPYELVATSENTFRVVVVDAAVSFVHDSTGATSAMVLHQDGEHRARRIR